MELNNKKPIRVLSLFDGMSCGQQALERIGANVLEYYASEIDKSAIKNKVKKVLQNQKNTVSKNGMTMYQTKNILLSFLEYQKSKLFGV